MVSCSGLDAESDRFSARHLVGQPSTKEEFFKAQCEFIVCLNTGDFYIKVHWPQGCSFDESSGLQWSEKEKIKTLETGETQTESAAENCTNPSCSSMFH